MAGTIKTKEAAERWGLTSRRVSELCKQGKITNARKDGKAWLIPADTPKPADQRFRNGIYAKSHPVEKLPLPIGISDYRLASTEYYYIDKTMFIKDFLDERPMVSLFTRPRRFGKTLNMDMLRTFFEKNDKDTSIYFRNKKIWACGQKYRDYQGKYPVIFVSFKDVKCENWKETYGNIYKLLQKEFERHLELLNSDVLNEYDKQKIKIFLDGKADENDCMAAFATLSELLDKHYGIAPIIIIDEYDTPIQQGYMCGFYDDIIRFMRNLFSGGLKDNKHLSYGFLTGILRVAKESIFSGLNNLKINTILDNKYSQYFGFTSEEVKEMARYYHAEDKYDEICAWYNGYKFGQTEIFNSWSVINYFSNECEPRAFWQSTGNNEIIGEVLTNADESIYEKLHQLLQGKSVLTYIDTNVIYPQIKNNPSSVYSFLLVTGYLKITKSEPSFNGDFMCEVALPNKEIAFVYNKEILQKLMDIIPQSTAISIQEALYSGDTIRLQRQLEKLLLESVSNFDTAHENFYHGLVLGLCAIMDSRYEVTSNRESGAGRYDISLMPKIKGLLPGILIELKSSKNGSSKQIQNLAQKALAQIDEKQYDTLMRSRKISPIIKYGVAFSGKKVAICTLLEGK
ncbi:MAG: ATP-binding protein [Lentisphaeria bacterium]|nr:ATP-binding protein [Lentisphaeria bacterium]